MNQLVNEALQDYVERRSRAVERDLEPTLAKLCAYRRRDPHFKQAIGAVVDAEATLGREDPAEGKVVIGKLIDGKLVEAPAADGIGPLRPSFAACYVPPETPPEWDFYSPALRENLTKLLKAAEKTRDCEYSRPSRRRVTGRLK